MNLVSQKTKTTTAKARFWTRFFAIWLIVGIIFGGQVVTNTPVAKAATNILSLNVVSARTEPNHPGGPVNQGDPIPTYKYLINVDNTGNPDDPIAECSAWLAPGVRNPDYPDSCDWPSIRAVPGAAPIFTQGTEADFATGGIALPDGKYLVSVLAEGYKIGGAHFTVPLLDSGSVRVALQPHPLPSATMRIKVYKDISPTNGMFDAPAEQGLAGAQVTINDILGQVSTDVYGSPLCTTYDAAGNPTGQTACLISDANGDIVVPNLGPNRYDVNVTPPQGGPTYIQTSTLEGSHSWDTWLQEGGTGLDNEFVVAGEPFPWTVFGFAPQIDNLNSGATGSITGRIVAASVYVPQGGGLPFYGQMWGGLNGAKVTGPVTDAWIALSDLQNGDTLVYNQPAMSDGTFMIENVPDGNYFLTYWDYRQMYILDWMQVTVADGQMTDLGTPFLTGWFTFVEGYVFDDANSNGFKDPGEAGVQNYTVVLKDRDNTEIDRMTIAVTTDHDGYYYFDRAYPMGSWMILEAYSDLYYGTGVSYKVENQPEWTTVLGNGVDVGVLPMLGQTGRLDWGVRPYDFGTNGGIVGTVFYDTTRNELDAQYQAVEGWAPGIPGLTVNLWEPVACPNPLPAEAACDETGMYLLAADGSIAKSKLLNQATTETWEQPINCQARDANGIPLTADLLTGEAVLPPAGPDENNTLGYRCLEGPLMGMQFQTDFSTLDGNYGLTDGCFGIGGFEPATGTCADGNIPTGLPAGDYLVEVVIPNDAFGKPYYKVVKEEDINVFTGDEFVPQIPPPACAGSMHTVDVAGIGADGADAVYNPGFVEAGGSPFEGAQMPLCDVKLVTVSNGKSIAPTFNFFTDVPIPGKWKGYIIGDLTLDTRNTATTFGEKPGLDHMPIGIYDFTNQLLTTITSDYNGVYEVLLPSTYTINCPTPSGVCPGTYYLLGNDPGQPGNPNPNYNPQYRTIGATFEIWPGVLLPSDLAPTLIGGNILAPGSTVAEAAQCTLASDTPQLFAVSSPYSRVQGQPLGPASITIQGAGFGATAGKVTLDDGYLLPVTAWSDSSITVSVPTSIPQGPRQLKVTAANGQSTVNGLTFHVLGNQYGPAVYEVGPGRTFDTASYPAGTFPGAIQAAIDAAVVDNNDDALVVVYPGPTGQWNPEGHYYENLLINKRIKLQGVGPGGIGSGGQVLGSVLDGANAAGDTAYSESWRVFAESLTFGGNQVIYEGPVAYFLAPEAGNTTFTAGYKAAIDGFTITGGTQDGFPNVTPVDPAVGGIGPQQGGGIFANSYARYLQITNNIMRTNGGTYAGAIRVGTPNLPGAFNDNQNDFVRIANNRILANGGTNLAGAIGIFSGAEGYEVAYNDVCGNFSSEYGGGISHYGYSPNGKIHHNRVYFNRSYDEAGGIMIAGELPADPTTLTPGAGSVDVYNNLIQANLGNDDGGGLRFLMAGNFPYNVYNNIIVNNVSTHEGGGISINDAPQVRVYNNTIMKNITTATAMTSNGFPAAAGLSSSRNSDLLQATLPGGSPFFSNPVVFNNIFWDNRAGSFTGGGISGIGQTGDPNPINYWDLGIADGSGTLTVANSIVQQNTGFYPVIDGGGNLNTDPMVAEPYDLTVTALQWRGNANFVDTLLVAVQMPVNQMGNYHIQGAPALDAGAASFSGISAPLWDYDEDGRPANAVFDIGADEISGAAAGFPATGVLDNFNRINGALGANWAGNVQQGIYRILSNQVQVRNSGNVWWNAPGSIFGAIQEAYFTFTKVVPTATEQAVFLKFTGSSPTANNAALIEVRYDATTSTVQIWTNAPNPQGWVLRAVFPSTFAAGDQLGARVIGGTVSAYKNGVLLGSTNVTSGPNPWSAAYAAGGGQIGVRFVAPSFAEPNDARFDDFGGGGTSTMAIVPATTTASNQFIFLPILRRAP